MGGFMAVVTIAIMFYYSVVCGWAIRYFVYAITGRFGEGITIEDNMAVLVRYDSRALLTYSLNAHAPWEGYRVSVNGTEGRAELEVVERSHVASPSSAALSGRPAVDPSVAPDAPGGGDRRDERPAGREASENRMLLMPSSIGRSQPNAAAVTTTAQSTTPTSNCRTFATSPSWC
jgi:hypothetical protein